jgi:hypothetical protein
MPTAGQSDQGTGRAVLSRDQANVNKKDLVQVLRALRSRCFGVPGLVVGTTVTTIKVTNSFAYCINGLLFTKGTADNLDVDAGFVNTGVGQFCKVRVEINSAGVVSAVQGGMGANQLLASFPSRSASKATLGWIEIPASFIFGTTSFAGAVFVDGDPDLDTLALEA